jgi:hypothetical protein
MRRTLALVVAVPVVLSLLAGEPRTEDPSEVGTGRLATEAVAGPAAPLPADPAPVAPEPEPTPGDAVGADGGDGPSGSTDGPSTPSAVPPVRPGPDTGASAVEDTFIIAIPPPEGAVAGNGPRWRYTVELDPSLTDEVLLDELATEVRAALHDPRSWARERTMEQVGDPAGARIRLVLAAPTVVDQLCGRVGLRTEGIFSCWNGEFAALNAWRWSAGAEGFDDLATYRTYLVNHEVGHGLGFGHVGCPADGLAAPVMMQQSKGLDTCVANGWPYP